MLSLSNIILLNYAILSNCKMVSILLGSEGRLLVPFVVFLGLWKLLLALNLILMLLYCSLIGLVIFSNSPVFLIPYLFSLLSLSFPSPPSSPLLSFPPFALFYPSPSPPFLFSFLPILPSSLFRSHFGSLPFPFSVPWSFPRRLVFLLPSPSHFLLFLSLHPHDLPPLLLLGFPLPS